MWPALQVQVQSEASVVQTGTGHNAVNAQERNFDVTADVRRWNSTNRSTQIQTGLFNGSANVSSIEQSGSKVVIGVMI
jgi:hypothetical protein